METLEAWPASKTDLELSDGGGVLVLEWGSTSVLPYPRLAACERTERKRTRARTPRLVDVGAAEATVT